MAAAGSIQKDMWGPSAKKNFKVRKTGKLSKKERVKKVKD